MSTYSFNKMRKFFHLANFQPNQPKNSKTNILLIRIYNHCNIICEKEVFLIINHQYINEKNK